MNASQASSPTSTLPRSIPDTAALLDSILRSADAHYAREDWVAARDFLCLAVQLAPDQGPLRATLGSLQYRLQDYPSAGGSFAIATAQDPENPDLYIQLAMVHIKLKQDDEARAALLRSLSLRPKNPTAQQMLGDLEFAAKRYGDAAQHYCTLLESNPNMVNLLLHLGKCLYELRDLASARWCFDRVIALEPSNAVAAEALRSIITSASSTPHLSAQ